MENVMIPNDKNIGNQHKFTDLYSKVNTHRRKAGLERLGGLAMSIELFYFYRGLEMDPKAKRCVDEAVKELDAIAGKRSRIEEKQAKPAISAMPLAEERLA